MERDPVFLDQGDEIRWRITAEGRGAKTRVAGKIIFWRREKVGEVAAAAAGDRDLEADPRVALQERDSPAAPPGGEGAHQAGCAASNHDNIVSLQLFRWLAPPEMTLVYETD